MKRNYNMQNIFSTLAVSFVFCILLFQGVSAEAATLRISPDTGVYSVGNVFTVSVLVNTQSKSINAADGQLRFNPSELQVVSATRGGSIFNLWTEEPAFSNAAGTVSFGGGSPSGYTGAVGNIITVTFRALNAGTPRITFTSGSVLAADGMGTNILTSMTGGTYTVSAQVATPQPEYVAPANTPAAPTITSSTHPNQNVWYKEKTITLSWSLPSDITAVRMLLDSSPSTIPTNVYDERISSRTIDDLDEGISYFHLQFRNADGWGRVSHYKIAIDTQPPKDFKIQVLDEEDIPGTVILFDFEDVSPVVEYRIQIDGGDPFIFKDTENTRTYVFDSLSPGYHTVVAEAFDSAGNSSTASLTFFVEAFEKPVFTEYPTRINTEVIPAIHGLTRPNAHVAIEIRRANDNSVVRGTPASEFGDRFTLSSNAEGKFIYIPDSRLEVGVYEIYARAKDSHGKVSEWSDPIRIIVEVPGYIALGTKVISFFSILIPLLALVLLGIFGGWYTWFRFKRWRKKIRKETTEAEDSLTLEFNQIVVNLDTKVSELSKSRKGKLTKAEQALIEQIRLDLKEAQAKIRSEIEDIEEVIN